MVEDRKDPAFWEAALGGRDGAGRLIQDRKVHAAILAGRWDHLYSLFQSAAKTKRPPVERRALATVLRNRRLFVTEDGGVPQLFTFHGFGTALRGAHERDATDGTYLATLFLVFFWIPIWPIRQVLASTADHGGWYVHGRVPLSNGRKLWRGAALVGGAAIVLLIAGLIWKRQSTDEVHFLNRLDFAVTVEMGGEKIALPPSAHVTRKFDAGPYHVTVRDPEGAAIEEQAVEVPGGHDVVAYNVLGAAPLYRTRVLYTTNEKLQEEYDNSNDYRTLAGRTWVTLRHIDHAWKESPDEITMYRGEATTLRSQVDVDDGGWRAAAGLLAAEEKWDEAAALARKVALARPRDVDAVDSAYRWNADRDDPAVLLELVERGLEAAPESMQAHRLYQVHHQEAGRLAEILPRYQAAYESDPESPQHGYLYARLAPIEVAIPILDRLSAPPLPEVPTYLQDLGWIYFKGGRWDEAAQLLSRLRSLKPEDSSWATLYTARAHAAAGRPEVGLQLLREALTAGAAVDREEEDPLESDYIWEIACDYARLRERVGSPAVHSPIEALLAPLCEGGTCSSALLAELALTSRSRAAFRKHAPALEDEYLLRRGELTLLSRDDVEAAARLARDTAEDTLQELDDLAQVSIACELLRTGEAELARTVFTGLTDWLRQYLSFEHLRRLPAMGGLSSDIPLDIQAALHAAAARVAQDDTQKAQHEAQARRLDTLGYVLPR